jgi:5,10-methylenetetrahydromethanopterin reductase
MALSRRSLADRLALYMQDKHSVREEMEFARYAEKHGFEAVWFAESRLVRDAIVPMAAVAAVTDRIKVASGVVNNWTRNVGIMASTYSTLYDLAPKRVILGVGAWWDPLASKVGIHRDRPLVAMKEYVTVLKELFKLKKVTFQGDFVKVQDIQLDIVYGDKSVRKIPIYIGATGMQMMELTGAIADGVVLNYLVSPKYNKEAMEHLRIGARKAHRRIEDMDRPQLVVCSMDEDADRALDSSRSLVTMYVGQQPHIAKANGIKESLVKEISDALGGWPAKPGGLEKAKRLVDDKLVDMLTASGTPDDCRRKVKQYLNSGATCPILYPLGDDVRLMIREMAKGHS